MDRFDGNKDDLFESSTMTFREHLEELRQCLVKAAMWLGAGVLIGLAAASTVVSYVKTPLEKAIHEYNVHRDLKELGFSDPKDERLKVAREKLSGKAFKLQEVIDVPPELQAELESLIVRLDTPAEEPDEDAEEDVVVDPTVEKFAALAEQKTRLQLIPQKVNVSSFEISESFMIWFKAALVVGAVISAPGVFYHLWSFVAAGLHSHERKYVKIYLPVSVGLFISGVLMAFFVVLQYVITFLLGFNDSMDVSFEPRLNYYISFVLLLPLGFGIAFQLPLVMLFLQRIGLLETEAYTSSWRIAVVVILVISMLVTPADWTSMILLAIPLIFLYILGILMCKFLPRGRGLGSAAYDPA